MTESVTLLGIVAVFAGVQSLVGVGLLVFGTPTLLLLGYPFDQTLGLLLPASLLISTLQIRHGWDRIGELKRRFWLYSVPGIVLGLALLLLGGLKWDLKLLVGIGLLLSALLRLSAKLQTRLRVLLQRYERVYLFAMGLVHGLSNMGGGFLTVYVSTVHRDKDATRANIAYGYWVFAFSQIAVLALLQPGVFTPHSLVLAALVWITYGTLGQAIYVRSSRSLYQRLITGFIFAYGLVLIGQRWF